MATATLGLLNHTELDDADDSTGWNDLTTADTDIKVEGTGSMSGVFRADNEQGYYDHGSAPVTGAGKVWRGWINTNNLPYMGAMGSNAYTIFVYDSSSESNHIDLFGSDTYPGGWFYWWQDMDDFTGVTLANVDRWGVQCGHDSNAKNVVNTWMDVMRYLDGYYVTGGTSGDEVTLADILTADKGTTTLYGYGIIQEFGGAYFMTGEVQIGNGATTTYFEMDSSVLICRDTVGDCTISAGLYDLNTNGSGCNCNITNSVLRGAGTGDSTRLYLDFSDTNATVSFTNNTVSSGGTVQFASGQTATGNTFDDCGQITHAGADMDDCTIKNYEGTADTAALTYNVAADPDGEMDGMTFIKGTASTHAIELGSNTPSSITLRDWTTSGYNGSNGQTDSTIYNNSGKSITISIVGGSGNFTYKNGASASTTLSIDPVSTTITVRDINTNGLLENARVLLVASDATGDLPYEESVTGITRSGSTATVSHTGHGMATGDFALISGANQEEYNGAFEITVTGVDAYTYTVPGTPTTPATGTIISTGGIFNSLTNASGVVTDSRSITNDQPVTGRVRLSTGSYLYKASPVAGTIDASAGFSATVYLIPDS
jgi:hypothetical protein